MPSYGPIASIAPGIVDALKEILPNNDIQEFNGTVDGETLKRFTLSIRPAADDSTASALAALRVCVLTAKGDPVDTGLGLQHTEVRVIIQWAVFIAARGMPSTDKSEQVTAHKVAAWHAEQVVGLAASGAGKWGLGEEYCMELSDLGSLNVQNLATKAVMDRRILEGSKLALWVVTGRQEAVIKPGFPDPDDLPAFLIYEGTIQDQLLAPDQKPEIDIIEEIDQP